MTAEEELQLGQQIQAGDKQAHQTLVLHNIRLACSVALKYRRQGLPLEDLVQEGCTGLMQAASKYDYRRGVKFSTYATWWVRQSVRRALDRTGRTIRLPTHVKDQLYRLEQIEVQLQQELQRQPSRHELAAEMELEVKQVRRIRHLKGRMISLDQPRQFAAASRADRRSKCRVGDHQPGRSDGSATGTDPAEPSQPAAKTDSEPQIWAGGQ